MATAPSRRARRRVPVRRRRFITISAVLCLVLAIAGWYGWYGWNRWNQPLTEGVAAPVSVDAKRFSVLIVGADDRPGQPGRSDTMLLGFVDLDQGSVKLLSLPRDSYTQIPGHGWDKINAAYSYGKMPLTKQTVEGLIGMPVDYTISVNMQGFQKIVDAVGGVDITVDENMDYDDPYDDPPLHIHLKKGPQHMDGVDALHYVRFRHDAESDWGRMKRQQNFLKALLAAAKQPANLTQIPTLIKLVTDNVQTNLSPKQLTQLAMVAKDKLSDQGVAGNTLTGDDLWTPEGYYLGVHFLDMRNTIHQLTGVTPDSTMEAKDASDARAYAAALPKGSSTAGGESSQPAPPVPAPKPEPGTTQPGTTQPGTTQPGTTQPGTTQPKPGTTQPGTTQPGTTQPKPGTGTADPSAPPWPLVVIDGSGGTQAALRSRLQAAGFVIVADEPAQAIDQTTIVWYNAPAQAADQLKALLPNAKFVHMTPGPGDPPLKLVLGKK